MASYVLGTSESSVSGSSSDEGWQDDVAEDLEIFVRLSKAGHFKRAEKFFRAFLQSHDSDFAVAAQYAENLIEQGAFGSAEKFLDTLLSNGMDMGDEERNVVGLLLSNARIYTRFDVEGATFIAFHCLAKYSHSSLIIAEDMSLLQLQTVIISQRIMDLVSRTRQTSLFDYKRLPYSPLKLDCKSDQDPTWEEVITELLKHSHIWEANTLLTIHLRHENTMGSDLLRILDAVPDENDTMYDLVRLTMLVSCSRFLLRQSWLVLMNSGVFHRCKECAQKLHLSAMDGITDPIGSSRVYQDFRLLRLEVLKKGPPSNAWDRINSEGPDEMLRIRERTLRNRDYMLLLASYIQGAYLSAHWLDCIGASREAIACLHPHATLSEEEFHATKSDAGYFSSADDILNSLNRDGPW